MLIVVFDLYNNPSHLLPVEAPTKTQLEVWQVGQLGIVSTYVNDNAADSSDLNILPYLSFCLMPSSFSSAWGRSEKGASTIPRVNPPYSSLSQVPAVRFPLYGGEPHPSQAD